MSTTATSTSAAPRRPGAGWIDVLRPREHGSWSLALEPVALGLLAAPSAAGGALALATLAGFLARRPLQLVRHEPPGTRRDLAARALAGLLAVALGALLVTAYAAGFGWILWLVPGTIAGAGFLAFDWRNEGRDGWAEVLGAAAFATTTAAIATAAGAPREIAGGLLFASLARAVSTVVLVRALVRGARTGRRRPVLPLAVTGATVLIAAGLARAGSIPAVLLLALAALGTRAAVMLTLPLPNLRPRMLGIQELLLGIGYVLVIGLSWPIPFHAP